MGISGKIGTGAWRVDLLRFPNRMGWLSIALLEVVIQ